MQNLFSLPLRIFFRDCIRHILRNAEVLLHGRLQETADLVTFTEEIVNGKLHFLCSVI